MAEAPASHHRYPAPLVGTLADPQGGGLAADNQFRRYRAALRIRAPDRGNYLTSTRSIFYEVGRRYGSGGDALAPPPEAAMRIDCSVPINPAEAANFEGLARRFSNFSPQWEMMDLAAIAERLAKGVAAASVYGQGLDTQALRAGQPIRVVALGTLDSPQTASTASVFIPRTVDAVSNDHVFAVLCAAANGAGAAVTTDVLRLDANTNQPIVPAVTGAAFTTACVEALRMVGANMEASGAGDVFAYAVTRAIHSIVSVVAHTDEGGIMRGLLRHDAFRVPYGGINQALRQYPGLPPLASVAQSAVSAWVDAIALKTAAVVAHCDPLVPGAGGLFPTVFVSRGDVPAAPGTAEGDITDAQALSVARQMAADLGRFAPMYMRALTMIFGLRSNSAIAEQHFCTAGARYLDQDGHRIDRHLRHGTVAPYFWVEPTSLIPHDFLGTAAEAADYAAKCSPMGGVRSQPLFEEHRILGHGATANHMSLAFKMRSARTSAFVAAYAASPSVLGNFRLYQFDSASVVLPGDQGPTNGTVADKHAAADPLSSYLWVRGQSAIPAPAEFMNTQSAYGAKVRLIKWDDDWDATRTDAPDEMDFQGSIDWAVTVPTGLAIGASNAPDRAAKRARTRAATALAQVLQQMRGAGPASSPVMEISDVPPDFGGAREEYRNTNNNVFAGNPGAGVIGGEAGAVAPQVPAHRGPPLGPTTHHQALRAPQLPRPGQAGAGGGGAAPPPLPPLVATPFPFFRRPPEETMTALAARPLPFRLPLTRSPSPTTPLPLKAPTVKYRRRPRNE
ncbi:coat protein [Sphaeropsis sapinea RNA virus 2]|uniref:Coat protein n=1 Tax=Sphaeropsis sapinea RNA virus 2 TaxID=73498 RepID=Q9YXE5_9VIRU|nr:coat protein [Sphaeropsis sapinea RNA virus 2]AAD11602.1 coat protein [Sphaeropsis sapinea RNA virus 2]